MFKAEVKLDEHLPNKAWLRVTHNGSNWSSIALNSQEEVQATIEALQSFGGLTMREADVCPRGGSHVWLHNVEMGWKVCAHCDTRSLR